MILGLTVHLMFNKSFSNIQQINNVASFSWCWLIAIWPVCSVLLCLYPFRPVTQKLQHILNSNFHTRHVTTISWSSWTIIWIQILELFLYLYLYLFYFILVINFTTIAYWHKCKSWTRPLSSIHSHSRTILQYAEFILHSEYDLSGTNLQSLIALLSIWTISVTESAKTLTIYLVTQISGCLSAGLHLLLRALMNEQHKCDGWSPRLLAVRAHIHFLISFFFY